MKNNEKLQASTDSMIQTHGVKNGETLKDIQGKLNLLGHNVGTIDGKLGPKTRKGLEKFMENYSEISNNTKTLIEKEIQNNKKVSSNEQNMDNIVIALDDLGIGPDGRKKTQEIGHFSYGDNGESKIGSTEVPYYALNRRLLHVTGGEEAMEIGEKKMKKLSNAMDTVFAEYDKNPKITAIVRKNTEFLKQNNINPKWVQHKLFLDIQIEGKDFATGKLDSRTIGKIMEIQEKNGFPKNGIITNQLIAVLDTIVEPEGVEGVYLR